MVVVAYSIIVSAPVPFGFRSYWDFVGVGVGPRGFWTKGMGPGLDYIIEVILCSLRFKEAR